MPSRFLKDIDRGYVEMPTKESPFSAPRQSLWGESSSPRFMSSRPTPTMPKLHGTSKPQNTPSTSRSQSTPNSQSSQSTPRTYITPKKPVVVETPSSPRRLVSANASGGASRVDQLTAGQLIEHERFGIGEVLSVEGTGENTKAHIRFKNAGDKQLLLKFARFRVLE